MAYVPPHLRNTARGTAAERTGGLSLEQVLSHQIHANGKGRNGSDLGYGRPSHRAAHHRQNGPCKVIPTQMTLHRPCACTLAEVSHGQSLLGSAEEFCDAFFHVRETPEAGLPLCCLRHPGQCEGRNTVIVVRLDYHQSQRPPFVARYHNKDKHYHAERVMMEDASLLNAIQAVPLTDSGTRAEGDEVVADSACVCTLRVYISLQPCHYSSSSTEISCTLALFAFHKRELLPRRIALELIVVYPYRSHWRPGELTDHPTMSPSAARCLRHLHPTELMSHEELVELGARALYGPSFHSKGNCEDRASVAQAVKRMAVDAVDK